MPTPEEMRSAIETYIERMCKSDIDGILELFADDGERLISAGNDARVYVWALETALGFLLETGDRDRDTEAVWQVGVELGARIDRVFVLGARLGVWLLLTPADMEDAAQASLEPFIRWHLEPIYLQAAFLMNLDTTLGFDRPGGTIWGLRFGMGAHF